METERGRGRPKGSNKQLDEWGIVDMLQTKTREETAKAFGVSVPTIRWIAEKAKAQGLSIPDSRNTRNATPLIVAKAREEAIIGYLREGKTYIEISRLLSPPMSRERIRQITKGVLNHEDMTFAQLVGERVCKLCGTTFNPETPHQIKCNAKCAPIAPVGRKSVIISEAMKKRWQNPEYRENFFTEELRERISEKAKLRWSNPTFKEETGRKISAGWTPEKREERREFFRVVMSAYTAKLEPIRAQRNADIFRLHAEGMTQAKIAETLGIGTSTVYVVLKQLRDFWKEGGSDG